MNKLDLIRQILGTTEDATIIATDCGGLLAITGGNVRKGSCTFNWLSWHKDFEEMIHYKNNAKPDSCLVRIA